MSEENDNEEYVNNILTEQAECSYGPFFADQSKCTKSKTETKNGAFEDQNERCVCQSPTNRTFENKYTVSKIQQLERNTSKHYKTSTSKSSLASKDHHITTE